MRLNQRVLTSMGVKEARARRYLPDLATLLPQHAIDTPLRVAHFLAQVAHESGLLSIVEENLNYSAKRLLQIFPQRFTPAQAQRFAGNEEAIGNRVYANRIGNGDEDSGDGYRYRGRGLMQTTGRANYRALAKFVGVDVVADPDLVAGRFAVHAAVFFWASNKLNQVADVDDVRGVTKRINGGFNGLAERMQLLARAKAALRTDETPVVLEGITHVVAATQLNLRRAPRVARATLLASLPQGTPVALLGAAEEAGWVRVRVVVGGRLAEGVVNAAFLRPSGTAVSAVVSTAPAAGAGVPPVHMTERRRDVTRVSESGRAFPLGEPGMPRRNATAAAAKARQLLDIIGFLDSEKKAHARYGPKSTATYCNIYAYDYCYLAQVYLPRVFWTQTALQRIAAREEVAVLYEDTVRELNANSLHDWLEDFGPGFGWQRVMDLDVLQAAANGGDVCLITAKRRDLNRSGHIVAVVPEHAGVAAARSAAGEVLRPVESQAGVTNHRVVVKPTAWWRDERFQSFAFWRHA